MSPSLACVGSRMGPARKCPCAPPKARGRPASWRWRPQDRRVTWPRLRRRPSRGRNCGSRGPGCTIKADFNDRSHVRGVISMARSPDPDCGGSQFFICHGDPTYLDHKYAAFGKLLKGDDVLEKIATTKTHPPDRPDKRI